MPPVKKIKIGGASASALEIQDARVPALAGNGGKVLAVNSGATGMEWLAQKDITPVTLATEKKTDQEFVYRACPQTIGANALTLDVIKGNTLVWNQKLGTAAKSGSGNNTPYYQIAAIPATENVHKYLFHLERTDTPVAGEEVVVVYTNQYGNYAETTDNAGKISDIIIDGYGYLGAIYWRIFNPNAKTVGYDNAMIYDLTLMFGEGHEPSSVAEFEALFSLPYYAYNAGEIINNKVTAIQTVGFNQWDEEWERGDFDVQGNHRSFNYAIRSKNLIPIFPSTDYYLRFSDVYCLSGVLSVMVFEYDANGNYLRTIIRAGTTETHYAFTTGASARFVAFSIGDYSDTIIGEYHNDICLNLSWSGIRNGEYEAYWKNVLSLPVTTAKSSGAAVFPNGMNGIGGVYDSMNATKAVKRFGVVDLELLPWSASGNRWSTPVPNDMKIPASSADVPNWRAEQKQPASASTSLDTDRDALCTLEIGGTQVLFAYQAAVDDSPKGLLVYELATPVEYELDEPLVMTMRAGTTEEAISPNADGISAPFRCDMTYGESVADAIDGVLANATKIENLKNSIPDTSNFIQKSQTAGLLKNDGTVDTTSYGTYSKPANGIPASDLASGVIPTVPTISTNVVTDKASDIKTSSPKSVYNEIHPAKESSQPSGGMLPNVFYNLGTISANTTISFASASDSNIENEYKFQFTMGSTAYTITWPAAITAWFGGSAPTINASKTYQVSVLNGLAVIGEF